MKKKLYAGFIEYNSREKECGLIGHLLYLSTMKKPLTSELSWIKNSFVTVRYWLCDKECSKEQANEDYVAQVMGKVECDFTAVYSEYTGHLWTDEELEIGGHDLLDELCENVGKYLILEVEKLSKREIEGLIVTGKQR